MPASAGEDARRTAAETAALLSRLVRGRSSPQRGRFLSVSGSLRFILGWFRVGFGLGRCWVLRLAPLPLRPWPT